MGKRQHIYIHINILSFTLLLYRFMIAFSINYYLNLVTYLCMTTIHMLLDKELNLMLFCGVFSESVFLPGWLKGFGKSPEVKHSLILKHGVMLKKTLIVK